MSVQTVVLESFLVRADFAEQVSYVPAAGGAAVTLTALVRRDQADPRIEDIAGRGRQVVSQARIGVLATVHAVHGGIVAPAIGDVWTLPKTAGGVPVAGWKAGPARGSKGVWTIPVELWEDHEAGGYDPNR
jgi:hypothetical protein